MLNQPAAVSHSNWSRAMLVKWAASISVGLRAEGPTAQSTGVHACDDAERNKGGL